MFLADENPNHYLADGSPTKLRILTEHEVKFLAVCLLIGFETMHKNGIHYRDFKGANVVFRNQNGRGYPQIIDFGFAHQWPESVYENDRTSNVLLNMAEYRSPELSRSSTGALRTKATRKANNKRRTTPYGEEADYWAYGVLLYELLTKCRPFFDHKHPKTKEDVCMEAIVVKGHKGPLFEMYLNKPRREYGNVASDNAKDLLRGLLNKDLGERKAFIKDIKNHPWFMKDFDILHTTGGTKAFSWEALQHGEIVSPFTLPDLPTTTTEKQGKGVPATLVDTATLPTDDEQIPGL